MSERIPRGELIAFPARAASDATTAGKLPDDTSVVATPAGFILPTVTVPLPCYFSGMTNRQANLAFSAFWKDETDEARRRFCQAMDRAYAAHQEVEAALSEAREELIGAMWRHYPAAARRIVAGMKRTADA
jgi:hypothetical protein